MLMNLLPFTLLGRFARLEPLGMSHAADLLTAGNEKEIWDYLPVAAPQSLDAMEACIQTALEDAAKGVRLPFAIIDLKSGRAMGSTSYLDIAMAHHRIEIGWTWLGAKARRTAINTECKYLLLRHAFEALGCGRVQLKTDARNQRSQTAIARIGAKHEGVLRQHMVMPNGYVRDTVMFSIIASEWPTVKAALETRLGQS